MSVSENEDAKCTQIDPWDHIRKRLIDVIDSDIVTKRDFFQLSQSKIGIVGLTDGVSYFQALDDHFEHERDAVVNFLINLTTKTKLHLDEGISFVPSILQGYAKQCRTSKEVNRRKIWRTYNLIGREEEIGKALDSLQTQRSKVGVWICGLGGMGKTSVADEVCRRLFGEKSHWRIYKVELREQKQVRDLVRSTLTLIGELLMTSYKRELSDGDVEYTSTLNEEDHFEDINEDSWRQRLIKKCCENSDHNKLILFENMDDILKCNERELINFFDKLVNMLIEAEKDETHQGKTRFIITSRPSLPSTMNARFLREVFEEIKVKELSEQQAVALFKEELTKQNIQYNEKDIKKMASICSNCPLAILSVSRVLKDISPSTLKETFLLYSNSTIHDDIMGIETCLQHSFSALDKSDEKNTKMCTLMQLSVFRTLKFDIEAARFVCGRTSVGYAKLEDEIGDLERYHFLESIKSLFESEPIGKGHRQKVSSAKCYYIHPLVYQFLKSKEIQYKNIVNKAREKYVEFMHKTISKSSKTTTAESLKSIAKYEPHFQTFYEYVIHLHTTTRPTLIDLPSTLSIINTEWLTDLMLDTTSRCQYFKNMISFAEKEGNALDLVYYKTCLAKLYFDNDRLERCHTILTEIDSIINKQKQLSKTANYLKHKKKIRDYPSALVLGGFWTMHARYLNIFEKCGEAKQYLKWALSIMQKKERDCWSQIANIYNLMGVIAFKSKEYSTARNFHSKALTSVEKEHDDFIDKDIFLTNIGSAFFKEWDLNRQNEDALQEAEIYYSRALSMDTAIAEKRAKMLKMRGKLYLLQEKFEASEKDLQESLDLWKQYVHPPHINLISSYHGISFLFVSRAIHMLKIEDPLKEAAGFLTRANVNYKEIKKQIQEGGFTNWKKNKVLYDEIKKSHTRVLKLLNKDEKEVEQLKMFYQDFEAGKYNKDSLPNKSLDLDDESSHMQSMFTYQNMESESDDSDSLSSDSEAYSLIVTSDEEISVTQKCDDETLSYIENTVSLPIAASCDTKSDTGTRKPESGIHSGSVDSGYGDSISSCSSSSDSNFKPSLLSIPSGSMEEDVFSSSEKSALNHVNSSWKRKFCNKQNLCSLKRQKGYDDDFHCMGPNNV